MIDKEKRYKLKRLSLALRLSSKRAARRKRVQVLLQDFEDRQGFDAKVMHIRQSLGERKAAPPPPQKQGDDDNEESGAAAAAAAAAAAGGSKDEEKEKETEKEEQQEKNDKKKKKEVR